MTIVVIIVSATSRAGQDIGVGGVIVAAAIMTAGIFFIMRWAATPPYEPILTVITPNLRATERTIKKRLSDLAVRQQQVSSVLVRAEHTVGARWDEVRETLKGAIKTLARQASRYKVKQLEIDLVREQNKLAPVLTDLHSLNYEQLDIHIKNFDDAGRRFKKLQTDATEHRSVLGTSPDLKDLIDRTTEVLQSNQQLRDALLGRQAVLVLQGVTALKDVTQPVAKPLMAIRELEVFNSQVAITDFSESFDELEAEYARVQAEEDVAQQVSDIMSRAER
jgi:hypothetical protein